MDQKLNDFLTRPRQIDRKIMRLRARIDELKMSLLPSGIRYDTDKVQTSPEDPLLKVAEKVSELEEQIRDLYAERAKAVQEISDTIEKLEDDEEKTVLECRWGSRAPVWELADMMHVSRRTLYRIQKKALRHLAMVL